jgi:hypothetical protein
MKYGARNRIQATVKTVFAEMANPSRKSYPTSLQRGWFITPY